MENVTAVEKHSESPENPSVEKNITPPRIVSSDKDQDAEPESSQSTFQIAILMGALCASVFLAALDITIISTPLATISEYFHSSAAYTWVGSTYMLADAAGTPVWGKLSDIWGRKPLLLVATAIFFLGSALSGAAVNIDMLIAGRAVQGFAGGGLLTLVNICISDMFSMRDRAKYYGVIGMAWALASACGPVIGGVLTQRVSWRWCFYINLPVTGSAFLIILFTLNIQTPKTPMIAGLLAVDWLGSFSVAGATVMFLLGLTFGGVAHPWSSAVVLCLLIFGAALFMLFILIEWKVAKYPLMPLRLYRNASNMASLASCFCHGSILVLGAFFLPLYFQATLGATALLSGVWLLPFALSMSFSAGFTGWYISATGRYIDGVRLAFALSVLGFGLLIDLTSQKSWPKIIIFQIICGVGIGPNFQALLIALQSQVKPQDYATATAAFGFMRNLATSIGLVIGNVIFQNRMLKKSVILTETLGPQMAELFYGGSAEASVHIADALPDAQKAVVRNAYYTSIRAVWFLAVAFAGAGLVLIIFIRAKELSRIHEQIKTGLESMDPPREEGTIRTPKQGEP